MTDAEIIACWFENRPTDVEEARLKESVKKLSEEIEEEESSD